MRNPSRAILLAVLMASLILPPGLPVAGAAKVAPAAAHGAKRIMLVGDSLAVGLGKQLETVFAASPGVTFVHLGKVSSGLANPAFFNWDARLSALVKAHHPQVVLLMFGANDDKPLPGRDGRSLPFGTPEWDVAYTARLVRMTAIIRADNAKAKIFFLGVPVMADPAFNTRMTHLNGVLAAMTRTVPDCAFVKTADVLAAPSGAFAAKGRHADGSLVKLRADDGVHISGTGSRLLAGRCLTAIAGVADVSGPGLLAALSDRDVRPVGEPRAAHPTAPVVVAAAPAKAFTPAKTERPARPAAPVKAVTVAAAPAKVVAPAPAAPVAKPVPAAPVAARATYAVADGDTLWAVARRLGVSPDNLAQANPGVDPRRLSIGQTLLVPAAGARVAQTAAGVRVAQTAVAAAPTVRPDGAATRTHTVSEGDNFWSVAKHYEVSVAALTQVNPGVEPTRLRIGQQLAIPATAVIATVPAASTNPARGYTVSEGDNFWSIAHRLGLDMAELKRVNADVDPLRLRPGQVLSLPESASQAQAPVRANRTVGEAALYPVAPGDTLWSLSRRFGVRLETMLSANGELDPVHLQVGQLVTIPGAGQPLASTETLVFPVSAGDTLWGIARRFDVSVAALLEANPGIDPLRLREGQAVRVPSSLAAVASPAPKPDRAQPVAADDQPGRLHSVVTGDTLWHLARRFGVRLDALLSANAGIDPTRLRVGQTVRLPGSVVSMAAR